MSKIVETFARAMCKAAGYDPDDVRANGRPMWTRYEDKARAALRAVKPSDISDKMLEAFGAEIYSDKSASETSGDMYRRAIAAAIAAGGLAVRSTGWREMKAAPTTKDEP